LSKKRILFHAESSKLQTGFSILAKNIIDRLYDTGKYEIGEFSIYSSPADPHVVYSRWPIFPIEPNPHNEEDKRQYNANPINQFGVHVFENVCLLFKPDIVCSLFDYWYSSYIQKSPFRDFFKFIWQPTVDSRPQRPSWIDTYCGCDSVLAYSYFGKQVLEEESNGRIKGVRVASPAVEDDFKPSMSKSDMRKELGMPEDFKIAMMVSRNQMRKLWPDLIESFAIYLDKYKSKPIADKSYLYIHTTNPDGGYDIDSIISNSGISNKILVTYLCRKCRGITICTYKGMLVKCNRCGERSMHMPSVGHSVDRDVLANLMNIADVGILAAIGEGWGMSLSEFKKIGVPVISIPYSAMREQVEKMDIPQKRHLGGVATKVQRYYTEHTTMQQRALFDRVDLAKKMYNIFTLSEHKYGKMVEDAKRCVKEYYTWDITAKQWEEAIDEMDIDDNLDWMRQTPRIYEDINKQPPPDDILVDADLLVRWCVKNWYPHRYFTEFRIQELVRSLGTGVDLIEQFNKRSFNYDSLKQLFNDMINRHNQYEMMRVGGSIGVEIPKDDFEAVIF